MTTVGHITVKDSPEIGSYFSIDSEDVKKYGSGGLACDDAVFFSTCRSAIQHILSKQTGMKKIALLPAFTCHAVVEPFETLGYTVHPYPVGIDFTVEPNLFQYAVEKASPSVILLHDYFGFNTNEKLKRSGLVSRCRERGITVIVDMTQSMFSTYAPVDADYYVGSIRKWMGIPDGAFAKGMGLEQPQTEDCELVEAKMKAMEYKHRYLHQGIGEKANVLPLYRQAEDILDSRTTPYKMSSISQKLMQIYDIPAFIRQRRENCNRLLRCLDKIEFIYAPFKVAAEDEAPFYAPVLVKRNRKELQKYLADKKVYATVIWGCPDVFSGILHQASQQIYDEILCIPCDQRYSLTDMEYICALLENFAV